MIGEAVRVSPEWLRLREPADAAARARGLVLRLRGHLPATGHHVVHDLACGSGSMGRWLAPRLPGPQHWVLHDHDPDLLEYAASEPPRQAADGAPVEVETRRTDINRLGADELAGADLITASALLDLMTADELDRLIAVCATVGCPMLITLSVVGHVELSPPDPLDARVAAAFDAHQRRGGMLGPNAAAVAANRFRAIGADVAVGSSPWRLGAASADLAVEWLRGWIEAAFEQDGVLAVEGAAYARRRLAQARAGRLGVTVAHSDLLVLP